MTLFRRSVFRLAKAAARNKNPSGPGHSPPPPPPPPHGNAQALKQAAYVVDAYGSELKGYSHTMEDAPKIPEPSNVWLSILTCAAPFYKSVLIVVPNHFTPVDAKRLVKRAADAAFPPATCTIRWCTGSTFVADRDQADLFSNSPFNSSSPSTSMPSALSLIDGQAPTPHHLQFQSKFRYDVVVLAADLFATMLHDAPLVLKVAHRALKPTTGLLAIFGTHQKPLLGNDLSFMNKCVDDIAALVVKERTSATKKTHDDELLAVRARRLQISAKSRLGEHSDIYMPFTNVKRRSFTSEYHMTCEQVLAVLFGLPEFAYFGGRRCVLPQERNEGGGEGNAASPIVFRAPVVIGGRQAMDPAEAVERLLMAQRQGGRGIVHVTLSHFIITCSNRPPPRGAFIEPS